jgi:hypothetical protein
MPAFAHAPGALYRIQDGVRRAKAALIEGHQQIPVEVIDVNGQSLGKGEVPIEALRSPKKVIRRITPADETRWQRAVAGAQRAVLPFPPITVQPGGEQGTKIKDVDFDFGGNP